MWSKPFKYLLICLKIGGCVADRVNPDQMLHSAATDLGLHSLLKPVYPNT